MIQQKLRCTGIIRNKIPELLRMKGRKKTPVKRFSKASLRKAIDDDEFMKSSLLNDSTKTSEIEMTTLDEPAWVISYKQCVNLLREVENLQNEIAKEKMKKMSSICQEKHDLIIQKFVEEATTKLNKCEKRLKQMEVQATFDSESTTTDRKAFTSMLMSMASNIREQARRLRGQQQAQLHRQRQLSNYNKDILKGTTMDGEVEQWLSEEDFEMLEQSFIRERDQEISKVVQSIYSLNAIYKELQNLVIEQGSLLDRIDENIDRTVESIKQANKHLEEANKKSESACFAKLRLFLIIAIGVLFLIFILKHS